MKLYRLISTSFGAGYLPKCPGTWGSLVGLVLALIFNDWVLTPLVLVLFFVGIWASRRTAEESGNKDPKEVVIDEVVGMSVSLLFLPRTWLICLIAFVLFRLLDIKKPGFIRKMEEVPDGWGIMLDDMGAGILTNLIIQVFYLIIIAIQTIQ